MIPHTIEPSEVNRYAEMDADATWRNSIDAKIVKISEDVGKVASSSVNAVTLRSEFDKLADQMRSELRREVEEVVKINMAQLQTLPDNDNQAAAVNANGNVRTPLFFQKPPRYREGEDPETFILFYELLANGNQWSMLERTERLPTYFPISMLPWFISLADDVKNDFNKLKGAFIQRFDLASDKQQLLIDYHDLRAKNCASLGDYAAKVQSIGLKLNKSAEENLMQFKLGLPVPTFRWIQERHPITIESALRLAMDFDAMFVSGGHAPTRVMPVPELSRQEEPMEYRQRAIPKNTQFQNRGQTGENFGKWRSQPNVSNHYNSGNVNNRSDYPNRSSGFGNTGNHTICGRSTNPRMSGGRRDTRLRNYQLDGQNEESGSDEREAQQDDVDFTAEWFRDLSEN